MVIGTGGEKGRGSRPLDINGIMIRARIYEGDVNSRRPLINQASLPPSQTAKDAKGAESKIRCASVFLPRPFSPRLAVSSF